MVIGSETAVAIRVSIADPWYEGQMEEVRYFYILVLAVFVISGRKFRDAWRDDGPKGKKQRLIFGGLCLACFLVVAFFEVRL